MASMESKLRSFRYVCNPLQVIQCARVNVSLMIFSACCYFGDSHNNSCDWLGLRFRAVRLEPRRLFS